METAMNRRDLETILLTLESTTALLSRAAASLPAGQERRRTRLGGFSLVEHVWHLADLEREAYTVRIRRLLNEDSPRLSDFDGARIARERAYGARDLAEGLGVFALARRRNVERLRAVEVDDWSREGLQDGVGPLRLSDIPRMMAEHDREHSAEIAALLAEIVHGIAAPPGANSAVA
jgi:hypothetical protein